MADLVNTTSGITRLNNHNYQSWRSRIKSYLEGQDLWEVVNGDSTQPPKEAGELRQWKIKAGKAMYVLKTTIEDELLGRIRDDDTPKMAWDTFASLFSKTNDARLQYLENELMSTTQGGKSISEYFTKIKDLCREISDLDPKSNINEERMRRIIIHGLKPEYNGFITAIRGWPTQPTLIELENLLANQESLCKQMAGVSLKNEEEALYSNNKKGGHYRQQKEKGGQSNGKPKKREDGTKPHRGRSPWTGGVQPNCNTDEGQFSGPRRYDMKCYNCGKKGHFQKNCWFKKKSAEGNLVTSKNHQEDSEED